jgi:succinyl-CoA synthetase beta subunit
VLAANLNPSVTDGAVALLLKLYTAYTDGDADLAEINPLIVKTDGKVHALDAKVTLDNNADFRHEWAEYEATQVRDDREEAAHAKGLQYVGLDGTVGVIANGAGLAMSTLDVVNQAGGKPANFLDIGGGANAEVMAGALQVINDDPNVKSIFINIFGGITRGEEVAKGIIGALEMVDISAPIVIRLDGTNAEEGRALLAPHLSDKLVSKPTMLEAAAAAVELAKKN